jgi:hypothetical protein
MPWAWYPANSRLAPHRILWGAFGYPPLYQWLVTEKRRPLRAKLRIVKPRRSIWERRRVWHQHFAGRLGEWPKWRREHHRPKRPCPSR